MQMNLSSIHISYKTIITVKLEDWLRLCKVEIVISFFIEVSREMTSGGITPSCTTPNCTTKQGLYNMMEFLSEISLRYLSKKYLL